MSREVAKKVLDVLVRHCAEQDALAAEIKAQCTEEEFKVYRTMIAQSMGSMYLDVMAPILGLLAQAPRPFPLLSDSAMGGGHAHRAVAIRKSGRQRV
jgi:hypothetical protein